VEVIRMSAKPRSREGQPPGRDADPGAGPIDHEAKRGSLTWVRALLGRSPKLEQRRPATPATPVDARREADPARPASLLAQQCAELGARLLVHDPATQAVRNLFVVHGELRANGWPGIEALPLKVLGRALTEAEILESDEPSDLLASLIENLRELKDAADSRVAAEAADREWETLAVPEVSDTNYDEYELMERSWAGTVPAGLRK
jgi:hypothetical protein